MKEQHAREMVEGFAKTATQIMAECGQVLPVMFFSGKDGPVTLDLHEMFEGPLEQKHVRKDAGMGAIRQILKAEEADWCLMIVEAWTAEMQAPKGASLEAMRDKVPADLENFQGRVEVVWFQFEDQDCGTLLAKSPIVREGDKPRLGPIEWMKPMKESDGRMVGLLPPRGRVQ
jgi:hypothetical protein